MLGATFRTFGQTYLDMTLRSGGDLHVRIVERPALWMSPDALAALRRDMDAIAGACLPNDPLTYGVFDPQGDALTRSVITIVKDASGAPIALNALGVMTVAVQPEPHDVLHLGLVMVVPEQRQRKLSWVLYGLTCFLIFMRRQMRPIWVSSVTQVPAVVGMVDQMFSDVWPSPAGTAQSLSHLMLGTQIMAAHRDVFGVGDDAGFAPDSFVISAAYTGGSDALAKTWDQAAKHRDAAYNDLCARKLDYVRGDDLLQIGRMDMAAMRRYLQREVPRGAIAGLMVTALMVSLSRVILPVTHWLDAGKTWRSLRPWGRSA